MNDRRSVPLSALQHFAFCPRQCALIHNEQSWEENWLTTQGQLLHHRVDTAEPETRNGIRYERSISVSSERLGIFGKLDLIEINMSSGKYKPVEYKRGKAKIDNWDRIQLCAQALCLEEMLSISITEGAIWYWQTRQRETVSISSELRHETTNVIERVSILLHDSTIPKAKYTTKCKACSLYSLCNPKLSNRDTSANYFISLFSGDFQD